MRLSHLALELSVSDINELLREVAPDLKVRITEIDHDGIHGQLKLLIWNVDFTARPSCSAEQETLSIDIGARKLVPIPSPIVQRQLQEAVKDAPPGVDVIRQTLRVHLPSLLAPFGVSLKVKELRCGIGKVMLSVGDVALGELGSLMGRVQIGAGK